MPNSPLLIDLRIQTICCFQCRGDRGTVEQFWNDLRFSYITVSKLLTIWRFLLFKVITQVQIERQITDIEMVIS